MMLMTGSHRWPLFLDACPALNVIYIPWPGISTHTIYGYMWNARRTLMIQDTKPKLLNRLNRVEGQVRGIGRMVEEDRYCIDVLTQIRAVRAALAKVESEMLKAHLDHCIESAIVSGDTAEQRKKASELIELLERSR